MDQSNARSERITAIVSTVVAIAILAAGVAAYQSSSAPVDKLVQLESDLRFQLEMGFRQNPKQGAERMALLNQVMHVWRHSDQSESDRSLLAQWLSEATIRSMPGSIDELTAIPQFGSTQPELPASAADLLVETVTLRKPVAAGTTPTSASKVAPVSLQKEGLPEAIEAPVPTVVSSVQDDALVNINLTELTARIAGYHDGLDELESRLQALVDPDLKMLTDHIEKLDEITTGYRFIKLYYGALTDEERRGLQEPRSIGPTMAEIQRCLERSEQTDADDFLSEFDTKERKRCDTLRRQLAAIYERVQ